MNVILPDVPAACLTNEAAARVAKRVRKLLRYGRLKAHQVVLVDCLLWSCRSPKSGLIRASYSTMQRLTRMSRDTIAKGLRVLERLGVLTRHKKTVRVAWHQGGTAVRQATSCYEMHPLPVAAEGWHTESATQPVTQTIELSLAAPPTTDPAALAALARRRQTIEGRLLNKPGVARWKL